MDCPPMKPCESPRIRLALQRQTRQFGHQSGSYRRGGCPHRNDIWHQRRDALSVLVVQSVIHHPRHVRQQGMGAPRVVTEAHSREQ
jgi:hypothetical protein